MNNVNKHGEESKYFNLGERVDGVRKIKPYAPNAADLTKPHDPSAGEISMTKLLESFNKELQILLDKTFIVDSNVILGYKSKEYQQEKLSISSDIVVLNEVIGAYCRLFDGKVPSALTFKEICHLDHSNEEALDIDLKLKYLRWKKVSIPNFSIKASMLPSLYDFSADVLKMIEDIKHDGTAVEVLKKASQPANKLSKYFNSATGLFEFKDQDDKDLLRCYTIYASDEKVQEIGAAYLFCIGLSSFKSDSSNYTFKELPEVDHRLMRMIKIDRSKYGVETGISIDLDRINNPKHIGVHAPSPLEGNPVTLTPTPSVTVRRNK